MQIRKNKLFSNTRITTNQKLSKIFKIVLEMHLSTKYKKKGKEILKNLNQSLNLLLRNCYPLWKRVVRAIIPSLGITVITSMKKEKGKDQLVKY